MSSLKILEKVTIGGDLLLKNRLALAPLTRGRCGRTQVPNDASAEYYAQRSTAGLVISEGAIMSKQAMVSFRLSLSSTYFLHSIIYLSLWWFLRFCSCCSSCTVVCLLSSTNTTLVVLSSILLTHL